MILEGFEFHPPPGWPPQPAGWVPPEGWQPDPAWPRPPADWVFWVPARTSLPLPASPLAPVEVAASTAQPVVVPSPPTWEVALTPVDPTPGATANRAGDRVLTPPPPPPTVSPYLSAPASAVLAPPPPTAPANGFAPASAPDAQLLAELDRLRARVAELEEQLREGGHGDVVDLNDERVLQEVGIYRYHHPLETSQEYRGRLDDIQNRIKDAIKRNDAVLVSERFTFNNSLAKGRRMTSDYAKLMLRAYNAEADTCVRSLRAGNVVTAKNRLNASVDTIARLGALMEIRINPTYHAIRIEELELTADFVMKVQEEREAAREERERLREERKAEQEFAAERERLEKERAHHASVAEALRAKGDIAGAENAESQVASLDAAIASNEERAANIRCGYVYVISNPGAFGRNVVKIGMTRRLEPMDRVRELGDASVPFPFDVHALFFSDDAVSLENELHKNFHDQRLNHINDRREFFFASPAEVREVLAAKVGNLLEYYDQVEATQYLQSRKYWPSAASETAADVR